MALPNNVSVRRFKEGSKAFKKELGQLPDEIKSEMTTVLAQILNGELPKGRRFKKLNPNDLYEVSLNFGYRFLFSLDSDGIATPFSVGTHEHQKKRIRNAKR